MDSGLTQLEVAERLEVDARTILTWEMNGTQPSAKHLERITEFLGYFSAATRMSVACQPRSWRPGGGSARRRPGSPPWSVSRSARSGTGGDHDEGREAIGRASSSYKPSPCQMWECEAMALRLCRLRAKLLAWASTVTPPTNLLTTRSDS